MPLDDREPLKVQALRGKPSAGSPLVGSPTARHETRQARKGATVPESECGGPFPISGASSYFRGKRAPEASRKGANRSTALTSRSACCSRPDPCTRSCRRSRASLARRSRPDLCTRSSRRSIPCRRRRCPCGAVRDRVRSFPDRRKEYRGPRGERDCEDSRRAWLLEGGRAARAAPTRAHLTTEMRSRPRTFRGRSRCGRPSPPRRGRGASARPPRRSCARATDCRRACPSQRLQGAPPP